MKVGLVCPYNMYKGGGVQECVLAIRCELQKRGHDAKVITPSPPKIKNPQMDGVIFIGTAAQIKSPFHTTAQVSVNLKTDLLEKVLDDQNFDILHFHEPWVPILSKQILSRSKSKNVATFHAKLPDTVMSRTIEKVITPYTKPVIKELNALTAVSDAAAIYVKSITDHNVQIIPNGIDLAKYKNTNKKRNKDLLYIGRLEKRKGVNYLLNAFSLVEDDGAKLIIAGDGPDSTKLKQLCKQLKLNDRVEFLGFISEKEKLKLYSTVGLVVSPAIYGESFGIVLLEAMASGVPIVAGNNPGYSSVLKDEGSLSLVNPKDTDSFARKIEMFKNNDKVRKLWLDWSKNYVKNFSYPNVVDQYESLYKKVLN